MEEEHIPKLSNMVEDVNNKLVTTYSLQKKGDKREYLWYVKEIIEKMIKEKANISIFTNQIILQKNNQYFRLLFKPFFNTIEVYYYNEKFNKWLDVEISNYEISEQYFELFLKYFPDLNYFENY